MVCYVGRHFQWASRIHQPTFNAPSKQRLVAYVSPVVLCKVFFLGHRVAEGKVYALDDKVKVMLDYKAPTSITKLRLPWFVLLLQKIH